MVDMLAKVVAFAFAIGGVALVWAFAFMVIVEARNQWKHWRLGR